MIRNFLSFALVMVCAGCAPRPQLIVSESNYLTYEHPFTDAAAEAVRSNAEKLCAERKKVAVRTSHACSLKQCTTSYQCMDKADAREHLPGKRDR